MRDKPKLQVTRDYGMFEMHDMNRPLHEDRTLLASMQKVGFMPSSPIQCVRNGNGKLKIVRGHHRLAYARRLGLPIWYVIDSTKTDIFDLEGGKQQWTAYDFLKGRAVAGNADCAKVIDFQKKHGLTLVTAAQLLGGQTAGHGNKVKAIKQGTFKVAADLSHANAVVGLTDYCRDCGIGFATSSAFVAALSMSLRVPEFDPAVFRHRVRLNGFNMQRRATRDEYLQEIDALYNYGAKRQRIPLAFKAKELSRLRKETFGGKNAKKSK